VKEWRWWRVLILKKGKRRGNLDDIRSGAHKSALADGNVEVVTVAEEETTVVSSVLRWRHFPISEFIGLVFCYHCLGFSLFKTVQL
jgi:hypothetical protein